MPLQVKEIVLDDWSIEELWRHKISARQVMQVQRNRFVLLRNKKHRRATHRLIGVDDGGRMLTICIEPLKRGTWQVITGWYATTGERTVYERV